MIDPLTLHAVTPVTGMPLTDPAILANSLGRDVVVTCSRIETGPASIESELDEALAVPGTITEVQTAAEAEAAAVVNLSHSKRTYPTAPPIDRPEPAMLPLRHPARGA